MENRNDYLLEKYYDIDNDVQGNYDACLQKLEDYDKDSIEYADIVLLLMRCELLMGKNKFITEEFEHLLSIYQENSDLTGEFFLLTTCGLSYRDFRNVAEATRVLNKAYGISQKLENYNLMVCGIVNFIGLDLDADISDSTVEMFEEVSEYVKKVTHPKIIGAYYLNFGYMLFNRGEVKRSLECSYKALDAYNEFYRNKEAPNILAVKSNIAEVHLTLKQYHKSIEMYENLYVVASKKEDKTIANDCLNGLVKCYEGIGNYKKAFNYLKIVNDRLIKLLKNVNSAENNNKLNDFLSAELEETKNKMLLSNLDLNKKTLELEQNIKQLNLISKVGKKITSITDERNLFEMIVKIIYDSINISSAALMVVDELNESIYLRYAIDNGEIVYNSDGSDIMIKFDNKSSVAAYCAREKTDLLLNDVEAEFSKYCDGYTLSEKLEREHNASGSLMYCRLIYESKLIGILTVQSKTVGAFTQSYFKTLQSISSYIAISFSNSMKNQELAKLSRIDGLTKLENRLSFIEYSKYIEENSKSYSNVAIVMADMNHLKYINDDISHIEGDKYLIEVSEILLKISGNHKVFRLGGDEFCVLMTDVGVKEVTEYMQLAKELCSQKEHELYPLSLAMGCAYASGDVDIEKMLVYAETTMYEDKSTYYEKSGYERRRM